MVSFISQMTFWTKAQNNVQSLLHWAEGVIQVYLQLKHTTKCDTWQCTTDVSFSSFYCPINRLFILYQISVVSQTATFSIDWRLLYLSEMSHQHKSCSPAAGSTIKNSFQFQYGHTERDAILTSQSRRVQSRCPAVWPPHAVQKDWSCWGADRAWTTRPWAVHRADILQSSPKNKETYKKHNWSSTELMPSQPKGWYVDEMNNFSDRFVTSEEELF